MTIDIMWVVIQRLLFVIDNPTNKPNGGGGIYTLNVNKIYLYHSPRFLIRTKNLDPKCV